MNGLPVDCRRLDPGEVVQDGDIMTYGDHSMVAVRPCRYDPGCCVGHVVELNDQYYRPLDQKRQGAKKP